jgi:acyl carrier protein
MKGSARDRITEQVRRQLAEYSISGPVCSDANLLNIGLNSLDILNLVLALEVEFDLMIPESEITPENILTIKALSRLIEWLLESRNDAPRSIGDQVSRTSAR